MFNNNLMMASGDFSIDEINGVIRHTDTQFKSQRTFLSGDKTKLISLDIASKTIQVFNVDRDKITLITSFQFNLIGVTYSLEIDCNSDASIIIIGDSEFFLDGTTTQTLGPKIGSISIYKLNGSNYTLSQTIVGTYNTNFGNQTSISDDGNIIITAFRTQNNTGGKIYKLNGSNYTLSQTITDITSTSYQDTVVIISKNGLNFFLSNTDKIIRYSRVNNSSLFSQNYQFNRTATSYTILSSRTNYEGERIVNKYVNGLNFASENKLISGPQTSDLVYYRLLIKDPSNNSLTTNYLYKETNGLSSDLVYTFDNLPGDSSAVYKTFQSSGHSVLNSNLFIIYTGTDSNFTTDTIMSINKYSEI